MSKRDIKAVTEISGSRKCRTIQWNKHCQHCSEFLVKWCSAGQGTRPLMWVLVCNLPELSLWVSFKGNTTYQDECASSGEGLPSFMTNVLFYTLTMLVPSCALWAVFTSALLFSFATKCTSLSSLFLSWMLDFLSTWSPGEILAVLSQLGFLVSHIWHVQSL